MSAPIPTLSPVGDVLRHLLLEQYKDKPRMEGILAQIGVEADMLDDANHELWNIYDIDTAVGAQLDILGVIANEPRKERGDAAYRAVLKVLFRTQVSGTPEDVIRSVKEYTSAPTVQYIPEYPAAFWVLLPSGFVITPVQLARVSPAGVSVHVGSWLAHEDDDPDTYPLFIELEDDGDWILIEDYGTADLEPEPPAPSTYTFTVSEEPLVAGALVTIAADALVALTDAGVVLADAVLGLEAVGVALASAAPGESVTILQYGTTGPFAIPYEVGQDLYLGVAGRWALVPPTGATISQRTGTSAALPGGGIGASINIQQPVWL